ncbi:MAG TPA: RT0821/Lpp0805 family surface protein [Alphaproteobacteria bacterium]|nr:RT0821/Lpp0805 family surface protein [Alphaproteobacteria bacterium]
MRPSRLLPPLLLACALALPAAADSWKDESGHGRGKGGKFKEEFWDGNCKVERKWEGNGEYKEERKCRGGQPAYAAPRPVAAPPAYPQPSLLGAMPGLPGIACNRDVIGGLLGGAAGGLLGGQIGSGSGRTAATIGGAALGLLVGGSLGRGMDEADQACVGQALEYGRNNQPVAWRDPDGGNYQVTPLRSFTADGAACREYETVGEINGRRERLTGTACRQPDGTWQLVK